MGIAKGRVEPPDWWNDKPEPGPLDEFLVAAFWDLSTMRTVTGTMAGVISWQIPWDGIRSYGEFRGLRGWYLECFIFVVRQMDNAWLKWERAELEKALKAKG